MQVPAQMVLQNSFPTPQPGRIGEVMTHVRERMVGVGSSSGMRLPSIRQCARTLGVSKSTVVEAYGRLIAGGEISSRRGSGFYVVARAKPLSLAGSGQPVLREIDPLWVMRSSLHTDDSVLKPGCGWLPDSWMPDQALRRALRAEARGAVAPLMNYSRPLGFQPLRECFSLLLGERGIAAAADQILLTDSGTQSMDLLCRLFVEPGDTVLVDDPCYFNFLNIARAHRANIVSVPYTQAGPDLAAFERALSEHAPKLYLSTGTFHNPTGVTASSSVQHRLLKLAAAHNLIIVEDDIFADFESQPSTRLAAFDGFERVIYVGSYSKTLSAAMRCGYIAARREWIEKLVDLRLATTFGGNEIAARVVYRLLLDGSYRRHMHALRARLAAARARTVSRLLDAGLTPWCEPRGGLFLWTQLPGALDAAEVTRRAMREGVMLAPGDVFSLSHAARGFLRFNVSRCAESLIFQVLERSMRIISQSSI
jgi:DNA-binding transcriptional MocR family regulator